MGSNRIPTPSNGQDLLDEELENVFVITYLHGGKFHFGRSAMSACLLPCPRGRYCLNWMCLYLVPNPKFGL